MPPAEQARALADALVDDVGDLIDEYEIARVIVELIEDECGVAATKNLCIQVWLQMCMQLPDDLRYIVRNLSHHIDYEPTAAAGD